MEYFLIQQDKRYANAPVLKEVFKTIDKRNICKEFCNRIARVTTFSVVPNKEINYLDFLDGQLLLVSTPLQNLFAKYQPDLLFKQVVLIDFENGHTETYWLPILERVACIGTGSKFNRDQSVLQRIVLKEAAIPDLSLFQLEGVTAPYVIVRLDLAESIMRRNFKGIKLTRLAKENLDEVKRK
ncbi:MAG TPA: hypothetical protein VIM29_06575 [Bacillota bacterium]